MRYLKSIKCLGFTLIEVMLVISIMGLITLIAIPNFLTILANDQAQNLANTLNMSLRVAQTEAIDRSSSVKICALSAAGSATCNDTATIWNFGWQIVLVSTGEVLHTYQPSNSQFVAAKPAVSITYLPSGFPNQNFSFSIEPQYCSQGYTVIHNLSTSGKALQTTPVNCP
jgi:prepilin-type N-terminal cleavage/methylation domain-containing protein